MVITNHSLDGMAGDYKTGFNDANLQLHHSDHRKLRDAHHQWGESGISRYAQRPQKKSWWAPLIQTGHISAGATRLYDLKRQKDARAIAQRVPNTPPPTAVSLKALRKRTLTSIEASYVQAS